ncbi:MAG: hypothetical protein CMJ58_27465 [Planctomycetaceae bacterium]|nr:hypothetical protein [Planctomycetaceae bacterium]
MLQDMELWTEIRRRVLTDEISRRQAAREHRLNYRTIVKIVGPVEPPGYRRTALCLSRRRRFPRDSAGR